MHPDKAEERIAQIDDRHPIRDPDYIVRAVSYGHEHGSFPGYDDPVMKMFCDRSKCFRKQFAEQ